MFVDSNYTNYHYVYSYGDNYVALVSRSSVNASFDNPQNLNVHIQYFYPSIYSFDTVETVRQSRSFTSIDVSDSFYERADCPQIILSSFVCIFFILFIINGLTRFVKRGGVFFGS